MRSMESSGLIYLVRHCATPNDEATRPVLLGQQLDMGLSAAGTQQAERLARYFANKKIDAIYASALTRAVHTARIINTQVDAGITFCSSLKEADMGIWEGRNFEDLMLSDAANVAAFVRDPGTYGYPCGENLSQVCRRALGFIEALATKHATGRIVVIAHRYVNRAVLAHFMGIPMQRVREIDQDPGCVNLIRVFRGVMELQAVNYTSNFELAEEEDEQCTSHSTKTAV